MAKRDPDTEAGRPPVEQWWTINGEDMLALIRRAHAGEDPDMLYLEAIANSEREEHEGTDT